MGNVEILATTLNIPDVATSSSNGKLLNFPKVDSNKKRIEKPKAKKYKVLLLQNNKPIKQSNAGMAAR